MRHALSLALAATLTFVPAVSAASNVTADDLVKLSAAGLNDDVLIALIESDGAVFKLSADDVLSLRERGLSQKVILAMLQTAKKALPAAPPPTLDAATGEPPATTPQVVSVETPQPVVVNVTQQVEQHVEQPRERGIYSRAAYIPYPVAVPVYVNRPVEKKPEPVYWGFSGQRRPDTWKEKK